MEDRKCLFCSRVAPPDIDPIEMRGGRGRWYSNGITHVASGGHVRFFLCPDHVRRVDEAWTWAKEGFIQDEIHELKGMAAVEKWLDNHPELKRLAKGSV